MQQLRDYLSKIDRDAINRLKETLIAEFSAILKLTEEQAVKLKPILEESFNQLAEMMDRLAREGVKSLEKFRKRYLYEISSDNFNISLINDRSSWHKEI